MTFTQLSRVHASRVLRMCCCVIDRMVVVLLICHVFRGNAQDIGARRAVAASNHNAVHDVKKSVGSQAAGLQQAVAKFKRKQAVEFEVVTETVSRFAQDKQKEVNALTAELDSIEGKVLAGYETLQTGVTKHGESLTEFVEARIGANEELQEQFRGMVGDEKAEVLQRLEAVRSALSETNAQLTTWQAEVDSKLEANAQHAEVRWF